MPKRHFAALALASSLLASGTLAAQDSPLITETGRLAGALRGSNLGLGLDLMYGLSPQLNARVGAAVKGGSTGPSGTNVEWSGNALLDFTPRGFRGFRLTGGLGYLDTEKWRTVTSDMGKVAAYAGVGWSSPALGSGRWRILVDAGSYYRFGGLYRDVTVPTAGAAAGKSALDATGTVLSERSRFTQTISAGAAFKF